MSSPSARNIILLTLFADRPDDGHGGEERARLSTLWNIFYHVCIPQCDLVALQKQSRKLMELAASADLWSSSPYGKWICFLDEDTRSRVRNIWSQYARTEEFTDKERREFELRGRLGFAKMYETKTKNLGSVAQGARSAGAQALRSIAAMSSAFDQYWKTGVVGGNRKDVSALSDNGKGRINPMFAISSASNGEFAFHYGSDPLFGFHVLEAFEKADARNEDVENVVAVAKSQFRRWYMVFSRCVKDSCIQLVFYHGEAVRLCYELQANITGSNTVPQITRLYKNVWSSTPLQISRVYEREKASSFDVIDTSNLVDHVGILNLLPAVTPLLSRRPSSVLYTESLLVAAEDPSSSLSSMLCSDVDTIALILGIAPLGHMIGFSTDSYTTEVILSSMTSGTQRQFRMRIPWKIPGLADPKTSPRAESDWLKHRGISIDPFQLANYFFELYLKMFQYEDWSKAFSGPMSIMRQITSPIASDLRYYTRLSLVKLIHMAKANVATDWQACMMSLAEKIEFDRTLMIGINSVQELYLHMHTFGLNKNAALELPPRDLFKPPHRMFAPTSSDIGLLGQPDVPSVVFVALVVPRNKLRIFTDGTPDSIGTPTLYLSVRHGMTLQNSFHAIQCFFGRLVQRNHTSSSCDVEEDNSGWSGSSDLIIACQIPLFTLLLGPREGVRVGLVIQTTPSTVQFTMKLGPSHIVFEAGLGDKERVWLLRNAPAVSVRPDQTHQTPYLPGIPSAGTSLTHVSLDKQSRASTLQIRKEFATDTLESEALKQGANVMVLPDSACALLLTVKGRPPLRLIYPYPICGTNTKTKVARTSSWVEVAAPIASALTHGGFKTNPFPVVRDGNAYMSWALPRISLRQQPFISDCAKSD